MRSSRGAWRYAPHQARAPRRSDVGGILFGIGIAVFGYCPGTSVAASGEGRRDAMVGVAGMLFGAGVFVALYPALQPIIKGLADWGKITLPQVTSLPPWAWVAGLVTAIAIGLLTLERFRTGQKSA